MIVANLFSGPFSGLFSVPFLMLLNRTQGRHVHDVSRRQGFPGGKRVAESHGILRGQV